MNRRRFLALTAALVLAGDRLFRAPDPEPAIATGPTWEEVLALERDIALANASSGPLEWRVIFDVNRDPAFSEEHALASWS